MTSGFQAGPVRTVTLGPLSRRTCALVNALSSVVLSLLFIHPRGQPFGSEPGEAVLLVTFSLV